MTNFSEAIRTFRELQGFAPEFFMPVTNDEEMERAVSFLYHFDFEVKPAYPNGHPLEPLAEALMHRIQAYEAEHYPLPPASSDMELRILLSECGLTQQELSRHTGISQSTISQLCTGRRTLNLNHARALAQFFGVDVSTLIGD